MGAWKVGDKGWYVPTDRRRRDAREIVVTAVGRKWAKFGVVDRFDLATGWVDGRDFSSPGRVYRSREDWRAATDRYEAWAAFKGKIDMQWSPPPTATIDRIKRADLALFGEES